MFLPVPDRAPQPLGAQRIGFGALQKPTIATDCVAHAILRSPVELCWTD